MQLESELEETRVNLRDKDAANGALRQEMGQLRQQVQCVCSDDECVICDA